MVRNILVVLSVFGTVVLTAFCVRTQLAPTAVVETQEDMTADILQPLQAEKAPPVQLEVRTVKPFVPLRLALAEYRADDERPIVPAVDKQAAAQTAELPPVHAAAPTHSKLEPAKPEAVVWNATLDQRQQIARAYLVRNCVGILKYDGMESAADKQDTETRFMAAKNANGVIAVVVGKLRQHPVFVPTVCPTEFVQKLFPKQP